MIFTKAFNRPSRTEHAFFMFPASLTELMTCIEQIIIREPADSDAHNLLKFSSEPIHRMLLPKWRYPSFDPDAWLINLMLIHCPSRTREALMGLVVPPLSYRSLRTIGLIFVKRRRRDAVASPVVSLFEDEKTAMEHQHLMKRHHVVAFQSLFWRNR
jgi:hypothetical protein